MGALALIIAAAPVLSSPAEATSGAKEPGTYDENGVDHDCVESVIRNGENIALTALCLDPAVYGEGIHLEAGAASREAAQAADCVHFPQLPFQPTAAFLITVSTTVICNFPIVEAGAFLTGVGFDGNDTNTAFSDNGPIPLLPLIAVVSAEVACVFADSYATQATGYVAYNGGDMAQVLPNRLGAFRHMSCPL